MQIHRDAEEEFQQRVVDRLQNELSETREELNQKCQELERAKIQIETMEKLIHSLNTNHTNELVKLKAEAMEQESRRTDAERERSIAISIVNSERFQRMLENRVDMAVRQQKNREEQDCLKVLEALDREEAEESARSSEDSEDDDDESGSGSSQETESSEDSDDSDEEEEEDGLPQMIKEANLVQKDDDEISLKFDVTPREKIPSRLETHESFSDTSSTEEKEEKRRWASGNTSPNPGFRVYPSYQAYTTPGYYDTTEEVKKASEEPAEEVHNILTEPLTALNACCQKPITQKPPPTAPIFHLPADLFTPQKQEQPQSEVQQTFLRPITRLNTMLTANQKKVPSYQAAYHWSMQNLKAQRELQQLRERILMKNQKNEFVRKLTQQSLAEPSTSGAPINELEAIRQFWMSQEERRNAQHETLQKQLYQNLVPAFAQQQLVEQDTYLSQFLPTKSQIGVEVANWTTQALEDWVERRELVKKLDSAIAKDGQQSHSVFLSDKANNNLDRMVDAELARRRCIVKRRNELNFDDYDDTVRAPPSPDFVYYPKYSNFVKNDLCFD